VKSIRTEPLNHAAEGDERIRTAEQALGTDPVYEAFLAETLRDEPRVEAMETGGTEVHLHVAGETYWRVSGTDLHALLEARKFVLARAEADRGRGVR
jgi:hypothetical protein